MHEGNASVGRVLLNVRGYTYRVFVANSTDVGFSVARI